MKQVVLSESLLSAPGANKSDEQQIERPSGPPVKISEGFISTTYRPKASDGLSPNFSRQYAHAYAVRLFAMRPILEEGIAREWKQTVVKKIADLCESSGSNDQPSSVSSPSKKDKKSPVKRSRESDDHEQHIAMREDIVVAVIGTIFKQQPEKPSILQELVEDNPMVPMKPKSRYISDKDVILLEDETTRVQLVPTVDCGITINGLVNGIVCAVRGKPTINGKFAVHDVLYATPKLCVWPSSKTRCAEMVFLSGLLLGTSNKQHLAYLDLLLDYLQGLSGCPDEHNESLKIKTRVFILGDSFGSLDSEPSALHSSCAAEKEKEKTNRNERIEVAKKLDSILDELSQTMEVFIIPGEKDPSESMFPQAPIHRCIFPVSSKRSTFHSMCNPTRLNISASVSTSTSEKIKSDPDEEALDVVLTSGQTVKDAMRNTDIDDPLEMSQKLLEWGHICPTAPDTIPLHPGIQDDIFVLKSLPNLFVIGNQSKFGLKEWKNTKIVTVPKFADTGVAVVLNKDMDIVPLTFKLT